MRRTIPFMTLLLAVAVLTACGTSDPGNATGVGTAGSTTANSDSAIHESDETVPADTVRDDGTTEPLASALDVTSDYFYRDSDGSGFVGSNEVIDYVETPHYQGRDFSDIYPEYTDSGRLPDIGYESCAIDAWYLETGELRNLTFLWQDGAPENYSQITLNVWSKEPAEEDHYSEYSRMDRSKMTRTTISSSDGAEVDVYGDLIRETGVYALVWTMSDGTYFQLQGHGVGFSSGALPSVLDFVLKHGIDFSDYPMELGAIWETVSLKECPDAFPKLIPTVEDDRIMPQGWVVLKDGVAQRAFLEYTTDWVDERQETNDYTYQVFSGTFRIRKKQNLLIWAT